MNTAVLIGRIGRIGWTDKDGNEEKIRHFANSDNKLTTFSLAVNRWDSRTSSEVTDWFNVEAWNQQADVITKYCAKGRQIAVEGRIRTNTWQDKTGESRQSYIITASNIRMLGSKRDAENDNF